MRELERSIARLSLLLAEVQAKESELGPLVEQLEAQRARALNHAAQGNVGLEGSISILEEVEERAGAVERRLRHLRAIKQMAQEEMASLLLLQGIDRMKAELSALEARVRSGETSAVEAEAAIRELRRRIDEASVRAAQPRQH